MKTLLETINHTEDYDIKCYVTITISTFIEYSLIRVESPFNIYRLSVNKIYCHLLYLCLN